MHHRSTQPDSGVLPLENLNMGEPSAKLIQMLRQRNRSCRTCSSLQTSNSKIKTSYSVVNKVSLKDIKDEYSYIFYENINVDEQFLPNNMLQTGQFYVKILLNTRKEKQKS